MPAEGVYQSVAIGWPFNWLAVLTELPSVTVNCFFLWVFLFRGKGERKKLARDVVNIWHGGYKFESQLGWVFVVWCCLFVFFFHNPRYRGFFFSSNFKIILKRNVKDSAC